MRHRSNGRSQRRKKEVVYQYQGKPSGKRIRKKDLITPGPKEIIRKGGELCVQKIRGGTDCGGSAARVKLRRSWAKRARPELRVGGKTTLGLKDSSRRLRRQEEGGESWLGLKVTCTKQKSEVTEKRMRRKEKRRRIRKDISAIEPREFIV